MPQYMLIIGQGDRKNNPPMKISREELMAKYGAWTQKLIDSGRLRGAQKLYDGQGRKLKLEADRVIDGPFAETKETIGGYYVVEAANYDEAVEMGKECPTLLYQSGWVEVRAVEI